MVFCLLVLAIACKMNREFKNLSSACCLWLCMFVSLDMSSTKNVKPEIYYLQKFRQTKVNPKQRLSTNQYSVFKSINLFQVPTFAFPRKQNLLVQIMNTLVTHCLNTKMQ